MDLQDSLHCYGLCFMVCADVLSDRTVLFNFPSNPHSCSARIQHTRQSALLRTRHRQGVYALHLDPHPSVGAVITRLRLFQCQSLSLSGSISRTGGNLLASKFRAPDHLSPD